MTTRKRAAIFGASGYTGGELLRYLAAHPIFEVVWVTADRNVGKQVGEVFGHVPALSRLELQPTDPAAAPELDVAFLALPHGEAGRVGGDLADAGVAVVDLSADRRLRDPDTHQSTYGATSAGAWTYGLPEVHRDEIATSTSVANPGCYPTAALLALVPVLRSGAVETSGIVVDAASGVSGAGRKVDADFLFSELDGSFKAYGVTTHRHTPEIEQELSDTASSDVAVTFTPHLVPMARGLLATCYATVAGDPGDVRVALESAYTDEPFVHVLPEGAQPRTKDVSGSNHARIGIAHDPRTRTAVITCAIDNLGKGAAGQAVQNANLVCGLDETDGLGAAGVYP